MSFAFQYSVNFLLTIFAWCLIIIIITITIGVMISTWEIVRRRLRKEREDGNEDKRKL